MNSSALEHDPLVALPWIVRFRYVLAAAICAVVAGVSLLLSIRLPWHAMSVFPAVIVVSNVVLFKGIGRALKSFGPGAATRLIGAVFALDTCCLTGIFMLSGGPSNPFSLLYLVHITLSAAILTKRWTWFLGALCTLCFGTLFFWYVPVSALELHHHGQGLNLHLIGMWIAFAVAAFLVALFSGKISELMRQHEETLRLMESELARKDRLASLVTLAAGAAHELSTPLGTIAIAAKELERHATRLSSDPVVAEESRLIRSEVERCRRILAGMSLQGATPMGEALELVSLRELLYGLGEELGARDRLSVETPDSDVHLKVPKRAVRQSILALAKNGLEASAPSRSVQIRATMTGTRVCITVEDEGTGISAEVLRRIGEPFYTTKAPGMGMGLGVFLVRTLAEELGGELTYRSQPGTGTEARLELPVAPVGSGNRA